MTSSGLPELSGSQDLKYVFDALQPHNTDAEATVFFTRSVVAHVVVVCCYQVILWKQLMLD